MNGLIWYDIMMTSAKSPSPYSVKASTERASREAWKAFNKSITSSWATTDRRRNYIQINFGGKKEVSHINIQGGSNTLSSLPKEFSVYGIDESSNLINIGSFEVENWENDEEKIFEITEGEYYGIRIGIISNQGYTAYHSIKNIEIGYLKLTNKTLIHHDGKYKKYTLEQEKVEAVYEDNKIHGIAKSDNTTPEGFVFTSDAAKSSEIYKVFTESTSIFDFSELLAELYFGIVFHNTVSVSYYILINAWGRLAASGHEAGNNRQVPRNWYIEISNDTTDGHDGTWTIVDNRTDVMVDQDKTTLKYNLSKTHKTKAIRLRSYGYTLDAYSRIAVRDLSFYGYNLVSEEIPFMPAKWQTVSSTVPTSTQFTEQGMDSLSPFLDRRLVDLESVPMVDITSDVLEDMESGKVLKASVDLRRLIDIRNLNVEVK